MKLLRKCRMQNEALEKLQAFATGRQHHHLRFTIILENVGEIFPPIIKAMENFIWVPIVSFVIVLITRLASRFIALTLQKKRVHPAEHRLTMEIRDILHQASSLSSPSTFSKAAKLRRTAASKEKELAQVMQSLAKERRWSSSLQMVFPTALEAVALLSLGYWYWGCTISTIASQSIRPFDRTLLWRATISEGDDYVKIGIASWLIFCTRVSLFLSKKLISN